MKTCCEMPLSFERKEHLKATVIGSGSITLTDPDQGNELERLTLQLLDYLFPFGAFHGPQRDHPSIPLPAAESDSEYLAQAARGRG